MQSLCSKTGSTFNLREGEADSLVQTRAIVKHERGNKVDGAKHGHCTGLSDPL